jgi:hypothetical protein
MLIYDGQVLYLHIGVVFLQVAKGLLNEKGCVLMLGRECVQVLQGFIKGDGLGSPPRRKVGISGAHRQPIRLSHSRVSNDLYREK